MSVEQRICPGRYLADASLWLMMANVLEMFDIGPPLDASGKPRVIGEVEYVDAHTRWVGFDSGEESQALVLNFLLVDRYHLSAL